MICSTSAQIDLSVLDLRPYVQFTVDGWPVSCTLYYNHNNLHIETFQYVNCMGTFYERLFDEAEEIFGQQTHIPHREIKKIFIRPGFSVYDILTARNRVLIEELARKADVSLRME